MADGVWEKWLAQMTTKYAQGAATAVKTPPGKQVCEADTLPLKEPGVCVDKSLPGTGSAPAPAPQCGGDDKGQNKDKPVEIPTPGSGGTFKGLDDSKAKFNAKGAVIVDGKVTSSSDFPGGTTGAVSIDAGQTGKVRVDMSLDYFEDNVIINDGFKQEFSVTWDVSVDKKGKMTISSPAPNVGPHKGGTWVRLDSVQPSSGKSHVQVSPKLVSGSKSGGVSLGVGVQTSAAPAFVQKTFRLDIKTCNIPEAPKAPARTERSHRVFFERPRQAKVSSTEEAKLIRWYQGLAEAARKKIEAGEELISVTGFASTTGGPQMNRELSENRAKSAAGILRSYAGSKLRFNVRGRGEYKAATADNVEDDSERRVEISVIESS